MSRIDSEIGQAALGLGLLLLALVVARLWIASRGGRVRVRTRDVSGQVVVADRVEGGIHQHRGDAVPEPEGRDGTDGRGRLATLNLVLGIVGSILAIVGAFLTFGGG